MQMIQDNKTAFEEWLKTSSHLKYNPQNILQCFEITSKYANDHGISKEYFFDIIDYKKFNKIRANLSASRIFKKFNKENYLIFEKTSKFYTKFLKKGLAIEINSNTEQVNEMLIKHDKHIIDSSTQTEEQDGICYIDFHNLIPMSFTKPISISYFDKTEIVGSWTNLYTQLVTMLYNDNSVIINELIDKSLNNANRADFAMNGDGMSAPKKINENLFLETNHSATDIVLRIKKLLKICNIDFSNVIIKYICKKEIPCAENKNEEIDNAYRQKGKNIVCPQELADLLDKSFAYGFNLSSPVDMLRLKNFADMFGVNIAEDEILLKKQISAHGIIIDGRVHFFSKLFYEELYLKVNEIFAEGAEVIFFEKIIEKNQEWAEENHIVDSSMLKVLVTQSELKVNMGKTFLAANYNGTEAEVIIEEIKRVWGDSILAFVDDIIVALPYIPEDKIRYQLSISRNFVRNEKNVYADVSKLMYTEEEKYAITTYVKDTFNMQGYVSISDIPLGHIKVNNDMLTTTALQNTIYNIFFCQEYTLKGKLLTKGDNSIDVVALTTTFCKSKGICTFDEILDFVNDLTGEFRRDFAFRAAYDSLVRVDATNYVSDEQITFDVDKIDALLDNYIKGGFDSITSIAVFTMFPSCGRGWNHYILESYVYRFSKKYRLELYNFNDKNAGIIVSQDCKMSFVDLLAQEIIRKSIPYTKEAIGTHLCQNGYTAKSKMVLYDAVIDLINKN